MNAFMSKQYTPPLDETVSTAVFAMEEGNRARSLSTADANQKAILKATEELVRQARLNQIALEHKSIGAIVDTRTTFPIEEPKRKAKVFNKADVEKRVNSRRGGRASDDIQETAEKAMDSFKERGINVAMLSGNYSLEQQIWKEKSLQPNYAQKRKYQFPELQEFREKMTPHQLNAFREKISEAIVNLADKYRAECRLLKSDMDINGVFHPEANAHRVHCIYLMKLQKGISSATIEDPILRAMRNEHLAKIRMENEVEERKEQILRSLEGGGSTATPADSKDTDGRVKFTESPSSRQSGRNSLRSRERVDLKGAAKPKKLKPIKEKDAAAADSGKMSRSKSTAALLPGKKSVLVSASMNQLHVSVENNEESEVTGGAGGGASPDRLAHKHQPDKIFKKMKREKISDPKVLLPEEANRLEKGDTATVSKQRDKNVLLDGEMSNWMLSSMQKTQISKVSHGATSVTSGALSATPKVAAASPVVLDFTKTLAKNRSHSPQKMLPFDEFYRMFESYGAANPQEVEALYTHNNHSGKLPRQPSAKSNISGDNISASPNKKIDRKLRVTVISNINNAPELSPKSPTSPSSDAGAGGGGNARGGLLQSEDGAMELSNNNSGMFNNTGTTTGSGAIGTGAGAAGDRGSNNAIEAVVSVNVIKKLLDTDPQFEQFLKIHGREQPNEKLLARLSSNQTKPRRLRSNNPLGKDAVYLTDSRGRASKDASKGFQNHFKLNDKVTNIDELMEEEYKNNLFGRLGDNDYYDEDDESVPSEMQAATTSTIAGTERTSPGGTVTFTRSSRNRRRAPQEDNKKLTLFPLDPDYEKNMRNDKSNYEMQEKLLAAWDALQVPAMTRYAFMRKYSTEAYSVEMNRAVDMWAEAALYVIVVLELVKFRHKLESNVLVMPLQFSGIITQIRSKVPIILATYSSSLVPLQLIYDKDSIKDIGHKGEPLSAVALSKVKSYAESLFLIVTKQTLITYEPAEAKDIIHAILDETFCQLAASLRRAHEDLDDVIPYGLKNCREWMYGVGYTGAKGKGGEGHHGSSMSNESL